MVGLLDSGRGGCGRGRHYGEASNGWEHLGQAAVGKGSGDTMVESHGGQGCGGEGKTSILTLASDGAGHPPALGCMHVKHMKATCSQHVARYLKSFKQKFW